MSNHIGIFILTLLILPYINSQNGTREYVVQRDIFNGFKANEFSVYDRNEKQLHYRIESNYGLTQNLKVIAHPSKQEIGRLQAKTKLFLYKAEFSIFNPNTNRWNSGTIEQDFKLIGSSFQMNWNGHRITVRTEVFSLSSDFYDENGQLLAEMRRRPLILFKMKYDMKVFSNTYPVQIYLLGLAVYDRRTESKGKG